MLTWPTGRKHWPGFLDCKAKILHALLRKSFYAHLIKEKVPLNRMVLAPESTCIGSGGISVGLIYRPIFPSGIILSPEHHAQWQQELSEFQAWITSLARSPASTSILAIPDTKKKLSLGLFCFFFLLRPWNCMKGRTMAYRCLLWLLPQLVWKRKTERHQKSCSQQSKQCRGLTNASLQPLLPFQIIYLFSLFF